MSVETDIQLTQAMALKTDEIQYGTLAQTKLHYYLKGAYNILQKKSARPYLYVAKTMDMQ